MVELQISVWMRRFHWWPFEKGVRSFTAFPGDVMDVELECHELLKPTDLTFGQIRVRAQRRNSTIVRKKE